MDEKDRRDLVKRLDKALDDVAELVREAKEAIAAANGAAVSPSSESLRAAKRISLKGVHNIPGKHRNKEAAWAALQDILPTRH